MTENNDPANIVLTGFMGVGKTAVGREVAAMLERPFLDLDDLIVEEVGLSIPEIFAQFGEDRFRLVESMILRKLCAGHGSVIATGGGALVEASNREMVTRTSLAVCLSASVSAIEDRVGGDQQRPLLATPDRRQRITQMMNARATAYAEIPYRIDTTGRTIAEVAAEVVGLADRGLGGLIRLPVATPNDGGYDILLGAGVLFDLPSQLSERGLDGDVAVVIDENVAAAWQEQLEEAFARECRTISVIRIPAGESHKNLATMVRIYDGLVSAGLDRNGIVIGMGGGVVGDMAGFAAATYLRGVPCVQAPTSLLAMVDSSVGGKTGVDLPQGKNLVGAFNQPELVVIDPDFLSTLPPGEFRNGLAEVVKHGIIADPELFESMEGDGPESLESMLARALRVKIGVVERDPYERGERAHLNLGHTFGHAIEQVSGYAVPHGQGVALGLIASAELAALRKQCSPSLPGRISALVDRLGLPTTVTDLDPHQVLQAMGTDKKRRGRRVRFILPLDIGAVTIADEVPDQQVLTALDSILQ